MYKVSIELLNNKPVSLVLTKGSFSTIIKCIYDGANDEVLLDTTNHDGFVSPAINWLKENLQSVSDQVISFDGFANVTIRLAHSGYSNS